MLEGLSACRLPEPQKATDDWIHVLCVKFEEVAFTVNEDHALEGFFGERIIANRIVGEIVKDFKSNEVAGRTNVDIPIEYRTIDDLDVLFVATGSGGGCQLQGLEGGESGRYLNDFVLGTFVDVWVYIAYVVENIEHECTVSGA